MFTLKVTRSVMSIWGAMMLVLAFVLMCVSVSSARAATWAEDMTIKSVRGGVFTTHLTYTQNPAAKPDAAVALYGGGFNHGTEKTMLGLLEVSKNNPDVGLQITYDLPGHGASSWFGLYQEVGMDEYAYSLRQVIQNLAEKGIFVSHLVLHSMGGTVALMNQLGVPHMLLAAPAPVYGVPWEVYGSNRVGGCYMSPLFKDALTTLQPVQGLGLVLIPRSCNQFASLYMTKRDGTPGYVMTTDLCAQLDGIAAYEPRKVGFQVDGCDVGRALPKMNPDACVPGECALTLLSLDNDTLMTDSMMCQMFALITKGLSCTPENGFITMSSTASDPMTHDAMITSPWAFASVLTQFFAPD